jgi:hypothetical protein
MRRMGIEALYRRPRTTKPEPGHKIYPYLLRGLAITRPNQVWAMEEDWFEYRLQNDLRFLRRIEQARDSLRAGRGIRLEDVKTE